jgi:hypothetical protein
LDQWIAFSSKHSSWVGESQSIYKELNPDQNRSSTTAERNGITSQLSLVWTRDDKGVGLPWFGGGTFYPVTHTSPPPFNSGESILNLNLLSIPTYSDAAAAAAVLNGECKSFCWPHVAVFRCPALAHRSSFAYNADAVFSPFQNLPIAARDGILSKDAESHPRCLAVQPVYGDLREQSKDVVGFVFAVVDWEKYLVDLVSETFPTLMVALRNSCGQTYSFKVDVNEVSDENA